MDHDLIPVFDRNEVRPMCQGVDVVGAERCGVDHESASGGVSRRSALRRGAATAMVAGTGALDGGAALTRSAFAAPAGSGPGSGDVTLITLGTLAGPPLRPVRAGISSVLVVHGKAYLVDAGRSSTTQFAKAGLEFKDLAGIFITHLHDDHVADYINYFLLGGWESADSGVALPRVPVYGPGRAGGLPPSRVGQDRPDIVVPGDRTPGIRELTTRSFEAHAYSTNIFMRDAGIPNPRDLVSVHEIDFGDVGASFTNTAPEMRPFVVMEDDRVRVSAILVPHYDVFPSFAFRFDIVNGKSVVFSGDTIQSRNVVALAAGCDVLVHEAAYQLDTTYMLRSHTSPQQVGTVATEAAACRVVLSHLTPGSVPDHKWIDAVATNYSGPVAVAADLQTFDLS